MRMSWSIIAVYPRVCGGTIFTALVIPRLLGLSPRVRGNQQTRTDEIRDARSIPACAGEPGASASVSRLFRVYPRVCGGTRWRPTRMSCAKGLSPRVRGNLIYLTDLEAGTGSIPACAGEPLRLRPLCVTPVVYPRVCGGTNAYCPTWISARGLSPRVRGNRTVSGRNRNPGRSIPACAGEPVLGYGVICLYTVYPRVCGGTTKRTRHQHSASGLSPRVRGNRETPHRHHRGERSIPACAGEPTNRYAKLRTNGVYPRVCGGTTYSMILCAGLKGLSPRVRGNRLGSP